MTDYFGNEIHIGDKVICTGYRGNHLDIQQVIKFTARRHNKYGKVELEEYAVFEDNGRRTGFDLINLTALGYEYNSRAEGLIKLEEDKCTK